MMWNGMAWDVPAVPKRQYERPLLPGPDIQRQHNRHHRMSRLLTGRFTEVLFGSSGLGLAIAPATHSPPKAIVA
jgi:hypothetical protein